MVLRAVMSALKSLLRVQSSFRYVATYLQLTAYLWPPQAHINDGASFDFIVVGAGSAGCVVANRLTEDENTRVLLIEAGPDQPIESLTPNLAIYLKNSYVDWNYTSQGNNLTYQCQKCNTITLSRGKMLGGSSSSNAMTYTRGSPHDFDTWADIVNDSTWSYLKVLPYFIKSENLDDLPVSKSSTSSFHGTNGYLGVTRELYQVSKIYLRGFKELGYRLVLDVNGNDTLGFTQPMVNIYKGYRQSSSYSFLTPIKDRTNLYLLKETLATKILFNKDKRATGVKVFTKDGKSLIFQSEKEVILSAGTINSAQLLMLSGIGPKEHLQDLNIKVLADLPVGKNFHDHPTIIMFLRTKKMCIKAAPMKPHKRGPSFIGYVTLNKSQTYPDYQAVSFIIDDPKSALQRCTSSYNFQNDICQILYKDTKYRRIIYVEVSVLDPKSRGEILLRSSNPKDYPLIYPKYFSKDVDLDRIVDYLMNFIKVLNTTAFTNDEVELVDLARERCRGLELGSREYWRCYALCIMGNIYHYVGTCAMGSVVDSRLRVRNVLGLRVVDASVIPRIVRANINAATIMIAEKASDFIKLDHKLKIY